MKKLSAEEFAQLPIKGKGRSSIVFNSLINLKEGEGLLIEKKDWNRKAAPSALIRYIEKKYQMRFSFGTLTNGSGWAVQRLNEVKKEIQKAEKARATQPKQDEERMALKSELTLFYLGRISFNKIERIEDTIKAAVMHFWKTDKKMIQDVFYEVIEGLKDQGHIVIEKEKTYIPLKQN
ncbi:MAG: hypothetical protein ACK50A_15445 [Sphingobacteriaceae bacterium]|jgi:uncharacterized protein (DUF2249 family)